MRRPIILRALQYPALGRWQKAKNEAEMDRKIDQANKDHCGCCDDDKQIVAVLWPPSGVALFRKPTLEEKSKKQEMYYEPFVQ